jgi:hypothetical protein
MLKNPTDVKEILHRQNSAANFLQISPASLPGVSASYCQGAVVGESGLIRIQMVKHNRSVMVAVCVGRLVRYHPLNSNSNSRKTPRITSLRLFLKSVNELRSIAKLK